MPRALTKILAVIIETVAEVGEVPDGVLYTLLQSALGSAWSIDVHTTVVNELVASGRITKTNHVLRIGEVDNHDPMCGVEGVACPGCRAEGAPASSMERRRW